MSDLYCYWDTVTKHSCVSIKSDTWSIGWKARYKHVQATACYFFTKIPKVHIVEIITYSIDNSEKPRHPCPCKLIPNGSNILCKTWDSETARQKYRIHTIPHSHTHTHPYKHLVKDFLNWPLAALGSHANNWQMWSCEI